MVYSWPGRVNFTPQCHKEEFQFLRIRFRPDTQANRSFMGDFANCLFFVLNSSLTSCSIICNISPCTWNKELASSLSNVQSKRFQLHVWKFLNSELLCLATLSDWFQKEFRHHLNQSDVKTKTNREMLGRVFPRFAPRLPRSGPGCIYFNVLIR